jgi:hypothetical protein
VINTLAAAYGRSYRIDFPAGSSVAVRHLRGFIDKTEYGALLLNVSYVAAHISLQPLIGLLDAFREFGAPGDAIADRYELVNKLGTILRFGASYDPGKWFAIGGVDQLR